MNKQEIERMAHAWQEVTENRFVIPEEIPANERTAFHGAAAAASKAGKKSFSFAGKTHPVTMKKDTATKIADQKEGYYKDMEIKKQDKEMGAKEVPAKKKKNGETATMNPKMDTTKGSNKGSEMEQKESTIQEVSSGPAQHALDGKDEMKSHAAYMQKTHGVKTKYHGGEKGDELSYHGPKKNVRSALGNHYGDHSDAKAEHPHIYKESTIRTALKTVLAEKENHSPNKDKAEDPDDAFKGAGAKQMKKDLKGPTIDIEKQSHDDAAKAGRAGPNMKARNNDNKQGDKKIVNPVAGVVTKENAMVNPSQVKNAYEAMYTVTLDDLDESMLGHSDAEKLNGGKSKDSSFKSAASHIDYHHRRSDGHQKSGGDQDKHRYQVAKKLGYNV